jgi:CRP/FNR family cyclic AMP-dependent transcriptional regulator
MAATFSDYNLLGPSALPTARAPAVSIDVRSLSATNRNAIIFEAFDRLIAGAVLELNGEADPRSLRNEFAQYRAGLFSWDARNLGSARWRVRLERIDEGPDIATFLSHCTPFANAKPSTIAELALRAVERTYQQGDTIFDEGETWPYLAFVRSGKVVYALLSPDGKTHTLGERLTHDPLNESGTFDGGGATARAEALTQTTIAVIPASAVLHAVRNDSELALGFLTAASQARRRSIDTIADLAFTQVFQRVAKFLMSYAPGTTGMAPGLPGVENLSQAQIAAAAGTVRDMAARALLRLKNASAVELSRGRVRSIDRARLETFAFNVDDRPNHPVFAFDMKSEVPASAEQERERVLRQDVTRDASDLLAAAGRNGVA